MRIRGIAVAGLLFLLSPAAIAQSVTAFVGVNVVPMDSDRVLNDQTVVVADGKIVSVGPSRSARIPDGAVRIAGQGKYLMPGLAEMHGHVPPPNAPKEFTDAVLYMYVANGITTVRGMLGASGQLELREKAARSEIVSPTLYLAGPSFSGGSIKSVQQAIDKVREQKREGWDLLKVHPGLTRDQYDAMARTAKETGIRFGGHVPESVGLVHAIDMGQETFDHVDGYVEHLKGQTRPVDETALRDIVSRTKRAGAWIVPTMALWETLMNAVPLDSLKQFPELRYMPSNQVQQWAAAYTDRQKNPELAAQGRQIVQNRMRILKALHDGGVPILLGTDAPQQYSVPGFSIHREMKRMVDAGMTPYQVLQSGTSNVGLYFKNKDDFGTIAAGKRADLILVDANPLQDIANVARRSGVMVRGRWFAEAEIQKRLEQIAGSYKSNM